LKNATLCSCEDDLATRKEFQWKWIFQNKKIVFSCFGIEKYQIFFVILQLKINTRNKAESSWNNVHEACKPIDLYHHVDHNPLDFVRFFV
jgi:hypothetical protein